MDAGVIDADFILNDTDKRTVYVVESNGLYKIGFASSLKSRLASIWFALTARDLNFLRTSPSIDVIWNRANR